MNTGVKILGVTIVLLGAAAVAVPYALQGMVAGQMTRRIEAATGLTTQIGNAQLSVLPHPHIEASNIRVGSASTGATIGAVRFDISVATLFGGDPQISDIVLDRPALTITRSASLPRGSQEKRPNGVSLDGLAITDGSLSYIDDRRQARLDLVNLSFRADAPGGGAPLTLTGKGQVAGKALDWRLSLKSPDALAAGRESPLDAAIGQVDLRGHVRIGDDRLEIPDLAANGPTLSLSGSGSLDFSPDAPMLTAALKAQRIDLDGLPFVKSADMPLPADRSAVRLADAAITLDVDEADAGRLQATAIRSRLTVSDGLMRLVLQDAKVSGGTLRGDIAVDATQPLLRPTLRASVSHLDLAPLLAGAAPPAQFAGTLDGEVNFTSAGASRDALMSNLGGTAQLAVRDAAVTGVDVPSYMRSVAGYLPPAWQQMTNRIDIKTLTAGFQIAHGVATTNDFHAVSPVVELTGKGDIDLTAQSFDMSFDPKISAAPGADGKPARNAGRLGVAILVQGPWTAPRLSADISNAVQNPQQTIETLSNFGQQLLGGSNGKGGGVQPDDIIKGLGGLLGGVR